MNQPSINQAPFESQERQGKESNVKKLRRQRDEAREQVNQLSTLVQNLNGRLSNLETNISKVTASKEDNGNPTPDEWFKHAARDDLDESQRALAIQEGVKAMVEQQGNQVLEKARNEIESKFSSQNQNAQVEREIAQTFGQEAINADSPIFKTAQSILAGRVQGSPSPEQIRAAFFEAGYRMNSSVNINNPATEDDEGPPPEEISGGNISSTSAEIDNASALALQNGDVKGSLKAKLQKFGYE